MTPCPLALQVLVRAVLALCVPDHQGPGAGRRAGEVSWGNRLQPLMVASSSGGLLRLPVIARGKAAQAWLSPGLTSLS